MDTIANWATLITAIVAGMAALTGIIWAVRAKHRQRKRVGAHFQGFLEFLRDTPAPPAPDNKDDIVGWLRLIEHRLHTTQYLLILESFESKMPLDEWP